MMDQIILDRLIPEILEEIKPDNKIIHPNAMEDDEYVGEFSKINNIEIYWEYANISYNQIHISEVKPILFIHGWTANRLRLHPLYVLYRNQGYPVFRMDLRGHGWSQKDEITDFSFRTMTKDIKIFCEEIILKRYGFSQLLICAHSMGGSLSLKLAIDNPDWLTGLIIMGSAAKWEVTSLGKLGFLLYAKYYENHFIEKYKGKKKGHIQWGLENFPMWFEKYNLEGKTLWTSKKATVECLREMGRLNILKKIRQIRCFVLIVAGKEDVDAPLKLSEKMANNISNSILYVIPNVNHDIAIGAPQTMKAIIDHHFC